MSMFVVKCVQEGCQFKSDMDDMATCLSFHHGSRNQHYCDRHKPNDLIPLQYPGIKNCHKCLNCLNKEKVADDERQKREKSNMRW